MAGVEGTHPSVDAAISTAHHGRGGAHRPEHGMKSATHGRGRDVVQPNGSGIPEQARHKGEQDARGPMAGKGQKGYPLTD